MRKKTITVEDWRKALEDALRRAPDEGMSSNELATALGISRQRVYARLHTLYDAGLLTCGFRPAMSLTGRSFPVPVYSLKGKSNAKKQR